MRMGDGDSVRYIDADSVRKKSCEVESGGINKLPGYVPSVNRHYSGGSGGVDSGVAQHFTASPIRNLS